MCRVDVALEEIRIAPSVTRIRIGGGRIALGDMKFFFSVLLRISPYPSHIQYDMCIKIVF